MSVPEYLSCAECAQLSRPPAGSAAGKLHCPRCGTLLERRKPNSLTRTWALVIAAAILYIPANVFPVLTIEILGKTESDTIFSGVVELFESGMWEVGALVFFASIMVPMVKLLGLTFLLISVHGKWRWQPRGRTIFYRTIETVGRWSMIDTFMISILVALVQLGAVATIDPGIGATCFAGVVIITIFAAASFDSRIIWDVLEEEA